MLNQLFKSVKKKLKSGHMDIPFGNTCLQQYGTLKIMVPPEKKRGAPHIGTYLG